MKTGGLFYKRFFWLCFCSSHWEFSNNPGPVKLFQRGDGTKHWKLILNIWQQPFRRDFKSILKGCHQTPLWAGDYSPELWGRLCLSSEQGCARGCAAVSQVFLGSIINSGHLLMLREAVVHVSMSRMDINQESSVQEHKWAANPLQAAGEILPWAHAPTVLEPRGLNHLGWDNMSCVPRKVQEKFVSPKVWLIHTQQFKRVKC